MKQAVKQIFALFLTLGITIGVYGGRLAIWLDENAAPTKVFPYPVIVLPEEQRKALEQGVRVESMEQLEQFLEAYLS